MKSKYVLLQTEPDRFSVEARNLLENFCEIKAGPFTRSQLIEEAKNANVLFVRLQHKIDKEVILAAPNLKVIASATTGLDHIDVKTAQHAGIQIVSLRGEVDFLRTVTATAELSWGLMLSLLRRIPEAYQDVLSGNWQRDLFEGSELKGKTLSIIGMGRLGRMVASYAQAFDVKVVVYDPYVEDLPESVERLSFESVLRQADIVSIHVPLNDETTHMFNEHAFEMMKPTSVLVNTSRGAVINSQSLLKALLENRIAGAALDVLEDEIQGNFTMKDNVLVRYAAKHRNLLLTPHIGGLTIESLKKSECFIARKIEKTLFNTAEKFGTSL